MNLEEINLTEIERYTKTPIGKLVTLANGASKSKMYGLGVRIFQDENEEYRVLVNNILISCETEQEVFYVVNKILLNIEEKHQQEIIPVITCSEKEDTNLKIRLNIARGFGSEEKSEVRLTKAEDLLISGEQLEEPDVVAEKLIERAKITLYEQGKQIEEEGHFPSNEDSKAIDFNLQRKFNY